MILGNLINFLGLSFSQACKIHSDGNSTTFLPPVSMIVYHIKIAMLKKKAFIFVDCEVFGVSFNLLQIESLKKKI